MPSTTTRIGRPLSDKSLGSKFSKRKGTRSVSTLTPSQLARKRANDREAQRAIRARTKEHIKRLERELEELRSDQNCDHTLQDLLRRNKALEAELSRLRGLMGMSMTESPYSADYKPLPDYGEHYVAIFGSSLDLCAANVPSHLGPNVSSPSSPADDSVSGYMPASVPTSIMPTSNSLKSLNDFYKNNMQIQGAPPSVYIQHTQTFNAILPHS